MQIKLPELLLFTTQRPNRFLRLASPPKLFHRSIQKNGCATTGCNEFLIFRLNKGAAAERKNSGKRLRRAEQFAQYLVLDAPKMRLARIAENVFDSTGFPALDVIVQVLE